jgi:general secretion pathway protein C
MKVTAAAALNDLRQLRPEQLLARASGLLPPWVAALLVIALAWKLAQLTWALMPQGDVRAVAPPPVGLSGATPRVADLPERLQNILGAHLFGEYREADLPVDKPPAEDLPEAANYKLLGVYYADDPKSSLAIIVDERGDARVYLVGDALARGAKLSAVEPTRVVIQRGANFEKLELPQEADVGAGSPMRSVRAPARREPPAGSQTSQLTEALAAAPQQLTELIRPQPVFADGKQLGYRVYPGRNRQQFTKLGLKPGDLVTQINGAPLDDPARGLEIFRVLEEGSQVSVTVERDGQPQVIVLDANSLDALESSSEQ